MYKLCYNFLLYVSLRLYSFGLDPHYKTMKALSVLIDVEAK